MPDLVVLSRAAVSMAQSGDAANWPRRDRDPVPIFGWARAVKQVFLLHVTP